MSGDLLRQAEAFERLERLEETDESHDLELLPDGRIRAERARVLDLLKDRLRSAEVLPTGPGWAVVRSKIPSATRELLGPAREVIAAGLLAPDAWSVVDLVAFLASGSQTGMLALDRDEERISIFFHQGEVVWGTSTLPAHRFGPFLLGRGRITRDQLRAALGDGPARLGRACVERGYLAPDELEPLMRAFVLERFDAVIQAERGLWSFSRLAEEALAESPFRLPTQAILVDGLRRMDETQVYRQRVRDVDTMVKRRPRWSSDLLGETRADLGSHSPDLPEAAETVLRALVGAASIRELMRRTGWSEFEVTRTVYHLLRADLVELVARPRTESRSSLPTPSEPREIVSIYGLALAEIMDEIQRTSRAGELLEAVNDFLEREGGAYRELLSELRLDPSGRIDAESLLVRYEMSGATPEQLIDALGELLFFALMRASEILGRRRGDDLARRVRLIHGMLRGGGAAP
ncbi:MAG: DUF4388 domain-containing protein [Myxococcota bacterium]